MVDGDWTVGTLKEYVDQRFADSEIAVRAALNATDKQFAAQLTAQKEAVIKAENATERRFESVNEFRLQLGDQTRTLIPRTEAEVIFRGQDARIHKLEDRLAEYEKQKGTTTAASGGMKEGWMLAVGVVFLIGAILAIVIKFAV